MLQSTIAPYTFSLKKHVLTLNVVFNLPGFSANVKERSLKEKKKKTIFRTATVIRIVDDLGISPEALRDEVGRFYAAYKGEFFHVLSPT